MDNRGALNAQRVALSGAQPAPSRSSAPAKAQVSSAVLCPCVLCQHIRIAVAVVALVALIALYAATRQGARAS